MAAPPARGLQVDLVPHEAFSTMELQQFWLHIAGADYPPPPPNPFIVCLQENGPTNVGDEHSDPAIMEYLGATKKTELGNNL